MGYDVSMERELEDEFQYISSNKINIDGLDEKDIEEINRFVEFIKNKNKNENNHN